jgi:hypothetical protein
MKASATRIIVAGSVASASGQSGAASAVLQYMLGLRALGHDVWFIDQLPPKGALQHEQVEPEIDFCREVMAATGFDDRFAVLQGPGGSCVPMTRDHIIEVAASADVLLNLSGILTDLEIYGRIPVRVFVDLDPGFNQLWAQSGLDMNLGSHTHFATVGLAIGSEDCRIPLVDRSWIRFCPPVAISAWPVRLDTPERSFTTVANWRSYGPIQDGQVKLGLKAHSFRRLLDLPHISGEQLSVALSIGPGDGADLEALRDGGWTVLDGKALTASVSNYRAFIGSSAGEIAVAKEGYVVTKSGWFSERSAAYLASGRPVVAESTGFERYLPTGAGLFAFGDAGQAAAGMAEIRARYRWHADQARAFAEEHFAAERVLARLLSEVHATRGTPNS